MFDLLFDNGISVLKYIEVSWSKEARGTWFNGLMIREGSWWVTIEEREKRKKRKTHASLEERKTTSTFIEVIYPKGKKKNKVAQKKSISFGYFVAEKRSSHFFQSKENVQRSFKWRYWRKFIFKKCSKR